MQQQSSSLSPIGSRVQRVPANGPGAPNQNNSQLSSNALNLSMRDNLNKSQNIVMPSATASAYAPQQLLQSSSRQKKTSLSFLRKSNITTASGQQNSTPQKNSLNLGSKRINMISVGSQNQPSRLSGLNQSKSQPGLVKIRAGTSNNPDNQNTTMYKQTMQDSMQGRKAQVDSKNPAKSLNATINLEQMLNGSKSSRVLPQPQRNSLNAGNQSNAGTSNAGSQRNSQNPVNFVAGDVDPVQISSLLNDTAGVSPSKAPIGASSINSTQVAIGLGPNGQHQATGNTPLKGRRKQPQQSPGAVLQGTSETSNVGASQNIFVEATTTTSQSALQSFIENNQQSRQTQQYSKARNPSNQSAQPPIPKTGSIGSDIAPANVRGSNVDFSENGSNVGSVSAAQSVTDTDDLSSLTNKFKALRRENQQLRNLLRQNESIISQNIDQLKQERSVSLRLCQAFLPLVKRFTKPEAGVDTHNEQEESKGSAQLLHETPKTPEELIQLLEKVQKDAQANEFFKKIFEQDPIASENKFLTETMQTMQARLAESDQRCELMNRLNSNLVDELASTLDELDALKRTVISSQSLVISDPAKASTVKKAMQMEEDEPVVPSFMRVMQAEQALVENYVYEEENYLAAQIKLQRYQMPPGSKNFDESSEAEVENENSIPQESSIAANVSFQNQRRATGTLNVQAQRGQAIGPGMTRGKSTPVINSSGASGPGAASGSKQQQKAVGNSTQSQQQSHQVLTTNPSASASQLSGGGFSRFNQSQRIMTQELRGLNNAQRARNTLYAKPKAGAKAANNPVKVQNFVNQGPKPEPETRPNQEEQKTEAAQAKAPQRSFSPVVFVKKYLNIGI